jgi:hypothetical protein
MDQDDYGRSVEVTFEEETLTEVLMQVDMFLRGCGYVIDTYDQLEYVEPPTTPKRCGGNCSGCN